MELLREQRQKASRGVGEHPAHARAGSGARFVEQGLARAAAQVARAGADYYAQGADANVPPLTANPSKGGDAKLRGYRGARAPPRQSSRHTLYSWVSR